MTLLRNKVAIVTGASSGIGAAIAEKFAEEGAKVAMVGRNQTKLTNVAQDIEKKGSKPLVIIADVTNEDDCRRIVNETINNYGKIDILVNNAGIGGIGRILDQDVMESFDKVMSTNVRSAVFMSHLVAPHLVETKGNIINISSIAAKMVIPFSGFAYCTSKAAIDHFTRCIALELAAEGVRVNAINPGPVKTDIVENTMKVDQATADPVWEMMRKTTALARISDAEEIADLAAFLASDKARGITGGTYVSDNGALIKGDAKRKRRKSKL